MLAALSVGAASAPAFAPSSAPTGDWMVVGGRVNAVAHAGNAIYLGGKFQGVARQAPGLAGFDPDSGDLVAPTGRLDPNPTGAVTVTALAADGAGGVYVAGDFAGIGGAAQPRLLRLNSAGVLDTAFKPAVAAGALIRQMAVGNGVLYLAGSFASVGGSVRSGGLAAVDAATGAVKSWNPATPAGSVLQLAVGSDRVYLGGTFTQVAGADRSHAAAVGLGDGAPLPWNPAPDGAVNALAVRGQTVYLGGAFTKLGDATRQLLAAVDAGGAGALRTSWQPPLPGGPINRIVADDAHVYVAGAFTNLGGTPRARLAALDATSGALLPWDPQANREPSDLALNGGRVYMSWAGGNAVPTVASARRCGLASVSADTAVATAWNPGVETANVNGSFCNPDNGLYRAGPAAIVFAGSRLWAGGSFDVANIRARAGLAALDATNGTPLAWAPALKSGAPLGSDVVHDLLPSADGATIYIGGLFHNVDEQTRTNAAAVTAAGTGTLTAWNPAPNGTVRALALSPDGSRVYLGGEFAALGAIAVPRLAAVGASTTGATTVEAWRPSPDGAVLDLLTSAGRLYAAGAFGAIGGGARAGLAAFDVAAPVAPALTPWSPALVTTPPPEIESIDVRDAQIVAGGAFSTLAPGHSNLAAFEIADGATAAWSPAVNGRVQTVAIDAADKTAYVTGAFTTAGDDTPRAGAAAFGTDGIATGWDPAPSDLFPAADQERSYPPGGIVPLGSRLVLTGAFTRLGGALQAGVAFFGAAEPPIPAGKPSISGNPQIGQRLECLPGRWTGGRGTLGIAWLRDGTRILGATSTTYTILSADGGHLLRCRETLSNAAAAVSQDSDPVTVTKLPPALDSPPAVAGEPWTGGTAQCTTGLWRNGPTNYAYRWFLDDAGTPVSGATTATYAVTAADQDHRLTCEVTAGNEVGAQTARSEAVLLTEAPPAISGAPQILGEPRVATRLSCEPGPWERAREFNYQWLRDRVPLIDAVAQTYVPTSRDLGEPLSCLVSASNGGGFASAESEQVVVLASARSTGTGRRANAPDEDELAAGAAAANTRAIDIRGVKLRSGRIVAITVRAPGAGSIGLSVVRNSPTKAGTKKTKAKTKTVTLATGLRAVRKAGTVTVNLQLTSSARRLLARTGRLGLRVTVLASFRPATASKQSNDRTTATLPGRAKRR